MTIHDIFFIYDSWWIIDNRSNGIDIKSKSSLEKELKRITIWWRIHYYIKKVFYTFMTF